MDTHKPIRMIIQDWKHTRCQKMDERGSYITLSLWYLTCLYNIYSKPAIVIPTINIGGEAEGDG